MGSKSSATNLATVADIDRVVSYLRHQASGMIDDPGGSDRLAGSMMRVAATIDSVANELAMRAALELADRAQELGGLTTDCVFSWSD